MKLNKKIIIVVTALILFCGVIVVGSKVLKDTSADTNDNVSQNLGEKTQREMPSDMTEKFGKEMPGDMSEQSGKDMPADMAEKIGKNMTEGIQGSGTTEGQTTSQLYGLDLTGVSKTGALEIEKVCVSSGDEVNEGDTIFTLTEESVEDTRDILESAVKRYKLKL